MNNNYAPCFKRIDFVVISSYIELPWNFLGETRVWFRLQLTSLDLKVFSRCCTNSAFHPSKVRKGVPDNTGAKIGSSTMRGQRIKHHWWYNLWLSTYVPGSVERIQIDKSQRSITMCYFVRYIQVQFCH